MGSLKWLTKEEEKAIEKFSSRLKKELGDRLVTIKLFGSKSRGDFDRDSDIDIFIVVRNDRFLIKKRILEILDEIDPYFELKISPVIYSEYEYKVNKEMRSTLAEIVQKEGIGL